MWSVRYVAGLLDDHDQVVSAVRLLVALAGPDCLHDAQVVTAVQTLAGLPVSGEVDPATWAVLTHGQIKLPSWDRRQVKSGIVQVLVEALRRLPPSLSAYPTSTRCWSIVI